MISSNSRYRDSTVAKVTAADGSIQLAIVPGNQSTWQFNYSYIRVVAGDRPDTLAARTYGDSALWWNIADANPEILDWTSLAPGTVLRVPDV